MQHSDTWLNDLAASHGIPLAIEAMLERVPKNGWCVEFGAWDGLVGSMSRALITQKDYHAVLIESDTSRFRALQSLYSSHPGVHAINARVGFSTSDNLDAL